MPQTRSSELTTGEIAVFDTESGELVILPSTAKDQWDKSSLDIGGAKRIAEILGGQILTKKQLKSLLLATDRVVLLT